MYNTNWLTRIIPCWYSTVISREEDPQDNPQKDRLASIKQLSSDDEPIPVSVIIQKLKKDDKMHNLYLDLKLWCSKS